MSKFKNLINQAKGKQVEQEKTSKSGKGTKEFQFSNDAESEDKLVEKVKSKPSFPLREVNLSIKVSETLRRHWVAEAKRQGTSITAEITLALNKRFGKP